MSTFPQTFKAIPHKNRLTSLCGVALIQRPAGDVPQDEIGQQEYYGNYLNNEAESFPTVEKPESQADCPDRQKAEYHRVPAEGAPQVQMRCADAHPRHSASRTEQMPVSDRL